MRFFKIYFFPFPVVTVVQVTVMLIVTVVAAVIQVAVDLVTNVTVVTEVAVALLFLKQEVILQIQTVVLPKIIMMLFNLVMHNFLLKSLECCFFLNKCINLPHEKLNLYLYLNLVNCIMCFIYFAREIMIIWQPFNPFVSNPLITK